jgi:hypothetical protein
MQAELDGHVGSRVDRLKLASEKRLDKELLERVRHVFALHELSQYMPCTPIVLAHCPGATNPSDVLTKAVDVRFMFDRFMHSLDAV